VCFWGERHANTHHDEGECSVKWGWVFRRSFLTGVQLKPELSGTFWRCILSRVVGNAKAAPASPNHIWILKCQAPKDILSFCVLTMSSFLAVRFTLRFPGIQMYLALSTAHLLNVPLPLEIQNRCCFCLLLLFSICVSFFEIFFFYY